MKKIFTTTLLSIVILSSVSCSNQNDLEVEIQQNPQRKEQEKFQSSKYIDGFLSRY